MRPGRTARFQLYSLRGFHYRLHPCVFIPSLCLLAILYLIPFSSARSDRISQTRSSNPSVIMHAIHAILYNGCRWRQLLFTWRRRWLGHLMEFRFRTIYGRAIQCSRLTDERLAIEATNPELADGSDPACGPIVRTAMRDMETDKTDVRIGTDPTGNISEPHPSDELSTALVSIRGSGCFCCDFKLRLLRLLLPMMLMLSHCCPHCYHHCCPCHP